MVARHRRIDLKKTLFLLPNLITLSSIFCGFDSIRIAATASRDDDFYAAALLLIFAMFFDMLDGRVARATKTQSAFGLQIDSLADVISFGVAPSLLVYQWSLSRLNHVGLVAAFLFTACGAVRLARFNVLSMGEKGEPTKPSKYIVGLPIPGAAGILVSIVVANHAAGADLGTPRWTWLILVVTLALSFFMVSTIKFRSFKDVRLNGRTVALVAFALGSSIIVSTQLKPAFVLVWLLAVYILLGLCETMFQIARRPRALETPRDSRPPSSPSLFRSMGVVPFRNGSPPRRLDAGLPGRRAHPRGRPRMAIGASEAAIMHAVRCPQCRKALPPPPELNPSRPFCSDRCKTIDLARWLDGSYAVAGEPVDVDPGEAEASDERARRDRSAS